MEEWYSKVRKLKDESEDGHKTEQVCHHVFHDIKRMKIKDKGKFKQRMGPEFGAWTMTLYNYFSTEMVSAVLNDDEFWSLTMETLG